MGAGFLGYGCRFSGVWVQVFWGMGVGSPGKTQGYPCQSLGGVHVVVLGLFEREVAYMIDHLH